MSGPRANARLHAHWVARVDRRSDGLGLALGEIENSRLRVLRMIGTMAVGGEALRASATNSTRS